MTNHAASVNFAVTTNTERTWLRYAEAGPLPGYDPLTRTWHTREQRPDLWPRDRT